jgi:hypothetical protein
MALDITFLSGEEIEQIKTVLKALIESLREKRAAGTIIPDEEFILNSLNHPERGDVKIYIYRNEGETQIFIFNRRDESNPFTIMDYRTSRKYPERKMLEGIGGVLPDGKYGLFMISPTDREMLKIAKDKIVETFSVNFGVSDPLESPKKKEFDLDSKSFESCTISDMWLIYKMGKIGDRRLPLIEKELFTFKAVYAKYGNKYREEEMLLLPKKYQQNIAQMIRDIYPYRIRVALRRDYPEDHKKYLSEVFKAILELKKNIDMKLTNDAHPEYATLLTEMKVFLSEIVEKDQELTRFV